MTASDGTCVADPTKTFGSGTSISLTVGAEYTPSFDGSGGASSPCGYLVYYAWSGTNGEVSFNVYEGKPPTVVSLGDCLKIVSSANGSFKKEKAAKGYKYKSLITFGEASPATVYSCYHFFVATFESTVNPPTSDLDTTSDLMISYYDGSLVKKKCKAPTVLTTPTGSIVSGKVYKTSKKLCGYYVVYTWTGTNGGATLTI